MIPIVYSTATGRIRRFFHLDDDSELESIIVGEGEALWLSDRPAPKQILENPKDDFEQWDLHTLQADLNRETGLNPDKSDDLYAIVKPDTGDIIGCITCDPACGDKLESLALLKRSDADKLLDGHKVDETTRTKMRPGVVDRDGKDVVIIEPVKPVLPPKPTDRDQRVDLDTPTETPLPTQEESTQKAR